MTLIELVASLSLFVIILGSLLMILNSASTLWSSARNRPREQTVAQNVLELLADDLQHAVTDSGTPSNGVRSVYPTFVLDTRTNQPPSGVQVVLQFARHAKRRPPAADTPPGIPLSLDAVFYTFVDNALYRHVLPLSRGTAVADAKPLGELLHEQRAVVEDRALHAEILAYMSDPTKRPAADWDYTLLAERIDLLNLPAVLPEAFARMPESQAIPASQSAPVLPRPPEYDYLETDVLPDRIDVAIRLHQAEDWAALLRLEHDSSDEAARQRQHLGLRFSKRITFPAQGGSRLP